MSDFTQSVPIFHSGYYNHASDILQEVENTPGLPRQFHYQEIPRHPVYTDREHVNINLNPYSEVPQLTQRDPITGRYQAMVYDVPFDPIHDQRKNMHLMAFGFGFLLLALTTMI